MAVKEKLIILIEPDEAVRSAISTLLRQHGWKIRAQANAAGLDDLLHKTRPVALISESKLPDMSAKQVLESSGKNSIPTIFLGHGREVQNAVDLIQLGARDFLEKPFPQGRLLSLLDSLALRQVNISRFSEL